MRETAGVGVCGALLEDEQGLDPSAALRRTQQLTASRAEVEAARYSPLGEQCFYGLKQPQRMSMARTASVSAAIMVVLVIERHPVIVATTAACTRSPQPMTHIT
jgi:hypothetical protein